MSLNNEYQKQQDAAVQQLVEKGQFDKATNHITFGLDAVTLPEGITQESMQQHVDFINNTASAVEVANAQLARLEHAQNDKLTTTSASFGFGGFNITSEHRLQQQVDESYIYGQSTTTIDYVHSAEAAAWYADQRDASITQATALFNK